MMGRPLRPAMGERQATPVPGVAGTRRRFAFGAALLLLLPGGGPLRAAPANPPYPPTDTFRSLQLTTFDCGRDNSTTACDRARTGADALLDHPRLPGRCKDVLWTIRQKATVAPANSPERREPIDAAGREVVLACRPFSKPAAKTDGPATPARPGGGGFGFGTGAPPRNP
jgi:hypothetical protein